VDGQAENRRRDKIAPAGPQDPVNLFRALRVLHEQLAPAGSRKTWLILAQVGFQLYYCRIGRSAMNFSFRIMKNCPRGTPLSTGFYLDAPVLRSCISLASPISYLDLFQF